MSKVQNVQSVYGMVKSAQFMVSRVRGVQCAGHAIRNAVLRAQRALCRPPPRKKSTDSGSMFSKLA